ncbi:MAG: hypothetical protein K8R99_09730 [Actinomycetia bacterium]|nr:hypothetical protein [Actinomycetes bacterium]
MTSLLGRVKSAGLDRLGFRASVVALRAPAPGFRLITLAGSGLAKHLWHAGDRISLRTPEDELRSYTPFDWDQKEGRARLLIVGLGSGPGTRFVHGLAVGDEVQLLGPKRSVNLDLERAPIIVGDETILGLCAAWSNAHPDSPPIVLLEAIDVAACQAATLAIGVAPQVAVRDRASLVAATVEAVQANPAAPLILSGRAQTIAAIRRTLKHAGLSDHPVKTRAYWDENRAGLD